LGGYAENSRDRVNAQRCNGLKGSASPNSKLTEENVREILLLRASGQSATTIASKLSISPTTVCGICTGKSWQHISRIGFDPATLAPGALRGSAHPCYRITPEIQARMQEMRSMGMTYRKIASILQFSESAVYQACKKATNHSIAPEH
jgi:DNA-binding CsgD family transcriptional regulator